MDHAITSERIYQMFMDTVNAVMISRRGSGLSIGRVLTVKVSCDLDILRQREKERGNRCPGSAEASLKYLWPKEGYDLYIDNGTISADENADRIITLLEEA